MVTGIVEGSGVRQRRWWRGSPARLTPLVGLVLGLAMSVLVSPVSGAHSSTSFPTGHPSSAAALSWANAPSANPPASPSVNAPSAKAQPAPSDRGSANLRHSPPGQPLAETARAFGSSALTADAAEGSDRPLSLSRTWAARSPGAVRRVLDSVAPRLGRAPPSHRVS
jgi:hypothetical protein